MRLGPAVRIAPVLFRPNPVLVEHQALPECEDLGMGEQLFTPYGPCPRIAPPCSGMGGSGNRSPGLHGPRRVEGPGSRARARTHPHAQFPVRPEELAAGTANLWPNGGSQVQGNQPVPVAGADHRAGLAADVLVPRLAPCRCSCKEPYPPVPPGPLSSPVMHASIPGRCCDGPEPARGIAGLLPKTPQATKALAPPGAPGLASQRERVRGDQNSG